MLKINNQMKEIEDSGKSLEVDIEVRKDINNLIIIFDEKDEETNNIEPNIITKKLDLLEKKEKDIINYLNNFKFTKGKKSMFLKADEKEREEIKLIGFNLLKELDI